MLRAGMSSGDETDDSEPKLVDKFNEFDSDDPGLSSFIRKEHVNLDELDDR